MSLKPFRLLIVGAGLTTAVTSSLIKQHFPSENIQVEIWEKSRGIGGRMNTNRAPDGQSTVDMGAQYITKTGQYAERHKKFFDQLLQAGVLRPFPGKIEGATPDNGSEHFMAPNGLNNVVKHFFNASDAKIKFNTFCQDISLCRDGESKDEILWTATTKDGTSQNFHGIILTIPVPQILQLGGTFHDCLQDVRPSLEQVQYSSRYALALYYSKETKLNVPWTAKYVNHHPCLRFVSIDSVKRDSASSCLSILVHTSVPFGLAHLETDIPRVENIIYGHFSELFPDLPRPTSTRCIRWRYSQVHKSYPGQPGAVAVSRKPLLVLAGDAFVHSNFSGCVESASVAFEKLQEYLEI